MTIKTEEIIFKGTKIGHLSGRPQTICDIFSYQPDNIEQMPLGNLYMIGELSCVKDCGHLNNLLASLIKREYYLYPTKGPFASFQAALKKANLHLKDLASQGNLEWLGKIHFICAAATQENLFFTQAGQIKAYLCRQNHFSNLSRKIIPEPEKPHPSKIFSSIVSSTIEAEDKIIFSTSAIDNLFSQSGLRQIIISQSKLSDISEQINRVLREQPKPIPLAILLLQVEAEQTGPEASLPSQTTKNITPPIDLNEILN